MPPDVKSDELARVVTAGRNVPEQLRVAAAVSVSRSGARRPPSLAQSDGGDGLRGGFESLTGIAIHHSKERRPKRDVTVTGIHGQ